MTSMSLWSACARSICRCITKGAFDDPRLTLLHEDALRYIETTAERFDIAIIDVPDPLEAGPAYLLFTQEFYRSMLSRLNPGGIMVAQSGPTGATFYEQCFSCVAHTVGSVFPAAHLCEAFIPSFGTTWGFVIGAPDDTVLTLTAAEIDRRIAKRVRGTLRSYDGTAHIGMFAVPKFLRQAVADGAARHHAGGAAVCGVGGCYTAFEIKQAAVRIMNCV